MGHAKEGSGRRPAEKQDSGDHLWPRGAEDSHDAVSRPSVSVESGHLAKLESFRVRLLNVVQDQAAREQLQSAIGAVMESVQSGPLKAAPLEEVVSEVRLRLKNTGVSEVIVNESGRGVFENAWGSMADKTAIPEPGVQQEVSREEVVTALESEYQIGEKLGKGGMGTVYQAHEKGLGREVAIKVLTLGEDTEFSQRFIREKRIQAGIEPRSEFVTVFSAGKKGRVSFVVMELLQGMNAGDMLGTAAALTQECKNLGIPFPMARWQSAVLKLFKPIAQGLRYLHEVREVDHRDMKLANIMLPKEVKPANDALLNSLRDITTPKEGKALSQEDAQKAEQAFDLYVTTILRIQGSAKLIDFGLAKKRTDKSGKILTGRTKLSPAEDPLTDAETFVGTPGYAAPELYHPDGHDSSRADMYAFGVCLFEALTGTPLSRENANYIPLVARARLADVDRKKMKEDKDVVLSNPIPFSFVEFALGALKNLEKEGSEDVAELLKKMTAITMDPSLLLGHEMISGMGAVLEVMDQHIPSEVRDLSAARAIAQRRASTWKIITALVGGAALAGFGLYKNVVEPQIQINQKFRAAFGTPQGTQAMNEARIKALESIISGQDYDAAQKTQAQTALGKILRHQIMQYKAGIKASLSVGQPAVGGLRMLLDGKDLCFAYPDMIPLETALELGALEGAFLDACIPGWPDPIRNGILYLIEQGRLKEATALIKQVEKLYDRQGRPMDPKLDLKKIQQAARRDPH